MQVLEFEMNFCIPAIPDEYELRNRVLESVIGSYVIGAMLDGETVIFTDIRQTEYYVAVEIEQSILRHHFIDCEWILVKKLMEINFFHRVLSNYQRLLKTNHVDGN